MYQRQHELLDCDTYKRGKGEVAQHICIFVFPVRVTPLHIALHAIDFHLVQDGSQRTDLPAQD